MRLNGSLLTKNVNFRSAVKPLSRAHWASTAQLALHDGEHDRLRLGEPGRGHRNRREHERHRDRPGGAVRKRAGLQREHRFGDCGELRLQPQRRRGRVLVPALLQPQRRRPVPALVQPGGQRALRLLLLRQARDQRPRLRSGRATPRTELHDRGHHLPAVGACGQLLLAGLRLGPPEDELEQLGPGGPAQAPDRDERRGDRDLGDLRGARRPARR